MNVHAAQLFRRADALEQRWCVRLNRACDRAMVRAFFAVVSRLGDGPFWYALILLLPVVFGSAGVLPAARMALVGVIGVVLYKYVSHLGIIPGTPALDRYSFPSGHTLHAVSFTILAISSFPALAVLLVPFACLVAASRVVLGLHYPTDVVAGALIGSALSAAAMYVMPLA